MIIARQKRNENIAEYLIYMWQIEDLIRANALDIDRIKSNVTDRFELTPEQRQEMVGWYEGLIDMMRREGVEKEGHLQINKNVLIRLTDLHLALLADNKFAEYTAEFYKTLPYIVELRSKGGANPAGELETCFNALYGTLLLRLQGREISPDTAAAVAQITRFITLLTRYYHLDQQGKLFNVDKE